jgi:hypothetical protein
VLLQGVDPDGGGGHELLCLDWRTAMRLANLLIESAVEAAELSGVAPAISDRVLMESVTAAGCAR